MTRHTIEASEKPIVDILCDKYLFSIPSYQRPYAWTTEHAGELLDDLLAACGETADVAEESPYFLGSVVLIKDPLKPEAEIVDGQQRLTTLTILLCVLRDLSSQALADAIHLFVCQKGNPITGAVDVFRLAPRERDSAFFRDTIQTPGKTAALPDYRGFRDARARMIENAIVLREKLSSLSESLRQRLTMFVVRRCFLVVVAASDQQSAFRIFSVLNSRGLDLSPADILKADIIGALPTSEQEKYTNLWEDIEDELGRAPFAELFGHIRMIHRKQKMQGTLIAEFREFVPTRNQPARFMDEELQPYAAAFAEIRGTEFESFKNAEDINRQLKYLLRLDNFDWQPPAIEIIARRRNEPDFILRFLTDLERLAYALFLIRTDASERIRRYGWLLAAIQGGEDLFASNSPLQLDQTERSAVRATLNADIYLTTRIRLPLLLRLDELVSGGSAQYETRVITVEHVLPQTPVQASQWIKDFPNEADRDRWVHKLANLVLLTRRKNSQAGNLDFEVKKEKYFRARGGVSNFALTSQVLSTPSWTLETLTRRQSEL
ncbi:MAG: DUF262 domain-containing protein, partial [Bradyrhizobium sp.]|nr:DUF262 domain-containing protein [Bradyrhizobium sp.]